MVLYGKSIKATHIQGILRKRERSVARDSVKTALCYQVLLWFSQAQDSKIQLATLSQQQ